MRINHNISAINAHRQLSSNQGTTSKSLQKLSSGLRINSAGDDAAGLAISEKMRTQIRGLEKAQSNAQDSISLIQTAEGALQQVSDILQRMRELGVQSMNGILSDSEKNAIASEMTQLRQEVDRIAETSKFNNTYLLKGTLGMAPDREVSDVYEAGTNNLMEGVVSLDVAAAEKNTVYSLSTVSVSSYKLDENGALQVVEDLAPNEITVASVSGATVAANDYVLVNDDGTHTKLTVDDSGTPKKLTNGGDTVATFDSTGNLIPVSDNIVKKVVANIDKNTEVYLSDVRLTLGEAKVGDKVSTFGTAETRLVVSYTGIDGKAKKAMCKDPVGTAFTGFLAFTDGNETDAGIRIQVEDFDLAELAGKTIKTTDGGTANLQIGANSVDTPLQIKIPDLRARALGIDELNIITTDDAKQTLDKIDSALTILNAARGDLGAYQNRLEYTLNSLAASSENLTAAESRIRDVDMAKEMMAYTQASILNQSATAMLAQANQLPQSVLQLLQGI